jgi:hypothetical protein
MRIVLGLKGRQEIAMLKLRRKNWRCWLLIELREWSSKKRRLSSRMLPLRSW